MKSSLLAVLSLLGAGATFAACSSSEGGEVERGAAGAMDAGGADAAGSGGTAGSAGTTAGDAAGSGGTTAGDAAGSGGTTAGDAAGSTSDAPADSVPADGAGDGGTPFDVALARCARQSACLGPHAPTSWIGMSRACGRYALLGTNQFNLADANLGPTQVQLECIRDAKDCDAARACVFTAEAQPAICTGKSFPQCSGDTEIICAGTSKPAQIANCVGAGMKCIQGATMGACGRETCDPSTYKPTCDANLLVTCLSGANATIAMDCTVTGLDVYPQGQPAHFAGFGAVCAVGSKGWAECMGDGAACDQATALPSCDGTTLRGCMGGKQSHFDCATIFPDMKCTTTPPIGHIPCALASPVECKVSHAESCSNGVIDFCLLGQKRQLKCADYGYSGCASAVGGSPAHAIAYCTP